MEEIPEISNLGLTDLKSIIIKQNNKIKELAKGNQHIIETIIEDYLQKNVNVFILTTPCHSHYRENIDINQYTIMQNTINDILNKYSDVKYLDFWEDQEFIDEDYDNNNHLSIRGAEKLSRKLQILIK